jgi:pyruvate dehydrogenase E1 component beta subunit
MPEGYFHRAPGLKIVAPATAADAKALIKAAIRDPNPVLYLEHKYLYRRIKEELPADLPEVPLGKARRVREGSDLTLVSWSKAVHWSAEAADTLAAEGVSVDLIDLRTIWPWDRDAVLESAARTGRVLIAHEAIQTAGFGAEIAATLAEHSGARVARCGGARIPVGYSPGLEAQARLTPQAIAARATELLRRT